MIYSISGKLVWRSGRFVAIETGGLAFKIATSERTLKALGPVGSQAKLFTHLHVKEDGMDLYGFVSDKDLSFFELLISVSGVGPKSALSILDVAPLDDLAAAIKAGRPDLLTRASGIGTKTAERIIVELKNKVQTSGADLAVEKMEDDADIVEALTNLGYRREEARAAVAKVNSKVRGTEERLKAALAVLGKK